MFLLANITSDGVWRVGGGPQENQRKKVHNLLWEVFSGELIIDCVWLVLVARQFGGKFANLTNSAITTMELPTLVFWAFAKLP